MTTLWRLIPPIEAPGSTQMAIDEWLLEQHRLGRGLPCLRFYTWAPIAISLGYHQRHYPDHWSDLVWNSCKIDLVQRPSGGRAVLHQGDITYSLITSGHHGRRRDVYEYLCQFLIKGWHRLGVDLCLGGGHQRYERSASCFSTSTAADLVLNNGYKVVGSAQLYRERCILQHGSIRLSPSPALVEYVFGSPITPPPRLGKLQVQEVIATLTEAAQQCLDTSWRHQPLSTEEQQQATLWAQAKQ